MPTAALESITFMVPGDLRPVLSRRHLGLMAMVRAMARDTDPASRVASSTAVLGVALLVEDAALFDRGPALVRASVARTAALRNNIPRAEVLWDLLRITETVDRVIKALDELPLEESDPIVQAALGALQRFGGRVRADAGGASIDFLRPQWYGAGQARPEA